MPTPMRSRGAVVDMTVLRGMKEASPLGGHRDGRAWVREGAVSVLRALFGQAILVISGRAAGCTKALSQRSEGAIFGKRSKPQGLHRSPHEQSPLSQVA